MTFLLADRVQVTATANTTVSFTLSGAMTSYQSFAAIGNGNTTYYGATDGTNWETGIGTYSTTGPTLTRTTILSSSNSGSAVTFSGTVTVWVDYPSEKAVIVNDLGDVLVNQSTDQGTGVLQVTGQSTFNGVVTDKSLNLQGGNNLVTYSAMNNAVWTDVNTTHATSAVLSPNGVSFYQTITATSTGNRLIQAVTLTVGSTYTASFYVTAGTSNYAGLLFSTGSNQAGSIFNLTGSGTVVSGAGTNYVSATITLISTGVYRCTMTFTVATAGGQVGVGVSDGSTYYGTFFPSASSGTINATLAQLELGTQASAYTPTTTAAITTTNNISVPSGQVLGSLGSVSAPTYGIGATNTGWYMADAITLRYAFAGVRNFEVGNVSRFFSSGTQGVYLDARSGTESIAFGSLEDLKIFRDAANTLAQRNSTNAQTFRLYNTYTDASNYERLSVDWTTTANTATISTQNAGTGSARTLAIGQDLYVNSVRVGLGNSNGSLNTVVGGANSMVNNTTGNSITSVGNASLVYNTTGGSHTSIGKGAMQFNTVGSNSTSVGALSLQFNTTASNLTAVGYQSLYSNTTNVATLGTVTGGTGYTNGTYTGVVMTLSSGSTALTYPTATIVVAGGVVTTVTITSAGVGFKDTTTVLTAPAASIGGTGSGFSVPVATLASGTSNVAVGYQAGYTNSVGTRNTFIGYTAGYANTTGGYSVGVGAYALQALTTGGYLTAVGYSAGGSATNINYGVFVGYEAGLNATGSGNTLIGSVAGSTLTSGANNTIIGSQTSTLSATDGNSIVIGQGVTGLGSNTTVIGNSSTTLTKVFGAIQATTYTVSTLPSASTSGVGARAFVTDALAPVFGSAVAGSGAVPVPVYVGASNTWYVG